MIKLRFVAFLFLIVTNTCIARDHFLTGVFFQPERMVEQGNETLGLLNKYQFSSYRSGFRWRQVEKQKGVYKIPDEKLIQFVNQSLQTGMTPLLVLGNTNALYGNTKPTSDEQIKAFDGFTAWNVDQFPGRKIIYEIYNEWWHDDMKMHSASYDTMSAMKYMSLIKSTSKVIRDHNPNAIIIAGSINPLSIRHVNWLDVMFREGLLKYVDGVSIHPYSTDSPADNFAVLDKFEDHLKTMNKGRQVDIYITEMGYSDSLRGRLLPFQQKNYTKQYFNLANKREFIKGIWWYSLQDQVVPGNSYESNFGLFDSQGNEKDIMKGYLSWRKEGQ